MKVAQGVVVVVPAGRGWERQCIYPMGFPQYTATFTPYLRVNRHRVHTRCCVHGLSSTRISGDEAPSTGRAAD